MRFKSVFLMKPAVIALGLACAAAFTQQPVFAQETQEQKTVEERVQESTQTRWEEQAEKTFGFEKGLGQKLMTQEEWREHQRMMQTMTAEEREQYRKEVHQRMMDRAKEKGISLPDTPGPRGPADRTGRGGMSGGGGRGR